MHPPLLPAPMQRHPPHAQNSIHAPAPKEQKIPVPEVLVDLNLPAVREFAKRLRFAPSEGRIWLDERRMVLLHGEAFSALREELIASVGTETARGLLTRVGYAAGCRDAELALRMAGTHTTFTDVVFSGAGMHAVQGFVLVDKLLRPGSLESITRENFYCEWTWKNSIEDESHIQHHGIGNQPMCWTEVGYSSGYLSTCVGQRILVREVECLSMGHAQCRSIARPVSHWEDAAADLSFMEPQPEKSSRVFMPGRDAPKDASPADLPSTASDSPDEFVVGASTISHILRHNILRVAPTNATVLLRGESGVGKSLIARDVHRNSRRAHAPFVEVNCAAIPEQLIESELFGVERGAYSGAVASRPGRFEAADGGTLFLDEIATLSMTAQGKLLRVLQNGQFERLGSNKTRQTNVRVIAATNEDLQAAVLGGKFRQDLFFRLNVFPLMIQPLRERPDDIPVLTDVLLTRFAKRHDRPVLGITARGMRALLHHSWPGNIRELENVLERGVILTREDELIDIHHLFSAENALQSTGFIGVGPNGLLTSLDDGLDANTTGRSRSLGELAAEVLREGRGTLSEMEEAMTREALKQTSGNISRAAALLGITRGQLDYRVRVKNSDSSPSDDREPARLRQQTDASHKTDQSTP